MVLSGGGGRGAAHLGIIYSKEAIEIKLYEASPDVTSGLATDENVKQILSSPQAIFWGKQKFAGKKQLTAFENIRTDFLI